MAVKFNGQGPRYCKNCGGPDGIHHYSTRACPNNGEDQTGCTPQIYSETHCFEPQDWEKTESGGRAIPCEKCQTQEGRTLFDDYFLAAITARWGGLRLSVKEEIEELIPDNIINTAYALALAAMKKREEYFSRKGKI